MRRTSAWVMHQAARRSPGPDRPRPVRHGIRDLFDEIVDALDRHINIEVTRWEEDGGEWVVAACRDGTLRT